MAVLDTTANEIVIRVLYDGPPEAGKTTSMRALATSFGQASVTPEENETGRTQWFDWMEYVGGRFEGCRIRCQLVSVPGQIELAHRRAALLATADVVVFVGDSSPGRCDVSLQYLADMRRQLGMEIGVVFQANKRDVEGAIALDELRERLGDARWSVGLVESVAADGTGIREAFVYAVRLALDRVREMTANGTLREGSPTERSADDLLALLRGVEDRRARVVAATPTSTVGSLLDEILAKEQALLEDQIPDELVPGAPIAPDSSVPSGAIWPPVEGRAILYDVSQLALVPKRRPNGDWVAGADTRWRLISARTAVYESFEAGKAALVQWARLHAACLAMISPRRCIVLASTGDGAWRLWQIVHVEESLRDLASPADLDALCRTAQLLVDINERLAAMPCVLACSLDSVGPSDASAVYIGFMPDVGSPNIVRPTSNELIAAELGPILALDRAERRRDLERALVRIPRGSLRAETVVASLFQMLAN